MKKRIARQKRKVEPEPEEKKSDERNPEDVISAALLNVKCSPWIDKVKKALDHETLLLYVVKNCGHSVSFAKTVIEEYTNYIALILVVQEVAEEFVESIAAPDIIDDCWKEHIIETRTYSDFCTKMGVKFIDRTFDLNGTDKGQENQVKMTRRLLERWIQKVVSDEVWRTSGISHFRSVQLNVFYEGGLTSFCFDEGPEQITIDDVKKRIFKLFEVAPCDQKLTYRGRALSDFYPLSHYGINASACFVLEQEK